MSATSSIAKGFEVAAAVETVIKEEVYTINIKTIVLKVEAMAAAKFELKESISAGDGHSFSSRRGRV